MCNLEWTNWIVYIATNIKIYITNINIVVKNVSNDKKTEDPDSNKDVNKKKNQTRGRFY